MKRFYIIATILAMCGLAAVAQDRPDITHQTGGGDRIEFKTTYDKPVLTYDENALEVIVEGRESAFYTVCVTNQLKMVVQETVIDGEYDIIDVSQLTSGTHIIALTSSNGNTYTWTFDHGLTAVDQTSGTTLTPVNSTVNLGNVINGRDK